MTKFLLALRHFLGTAPGSIKGHVNAVELVQVALATPVGAGAVAIVAYMLNHAADVFPDPADARTATVLLSAAGAILTAVVEVRRRLDQGATPRPAA